MSLVQMQRSDGSLHTISADIQSLQFYADPAAEAVNNLADAMRFTGNATATF